MTLGPTFLEAAAASTIVKNWRPRPQADLESMHKLSGTTHKLEFENIGHNISVSFTKVKGHPELIIVRSTNWRYEDEPTGVCAVEDCRAFYVTLVRAGFTAF